MGTSPSTGATLSTPTLHFKPAPIAGAFMGSAADVRGIVGPWGSGKSTVCVMELLRRAREQKPGPDGKRRTRFAVIRNSYRELNDSARKTFEYWLGKLGTWSEQDLTFHLSCGDIRSEILFRSLDAAGDGRKFLSVDLTGAYFNEAKELSKAHFDLVHARCNRYPGMMDGGVTWHGVWLDSNPWHSTHWLARMFRDTPAFKLYRQPGGRTPEAENRENLSSDYYDNLCRGKDQEWVNVNVNGQDPVAAEGSVYGRLLAALGERAGLESFAHPLTECFSCWDIGTSDSTACWTYRINEETRLPDILDYFEGSGESFEFYARIIESQPYTYLRHFLPWDAKPASWSTGKSHAEQVMQRWPGKVAVVPRNLVEDGIAAARWLLERKPRFHPRCKDGIEMLRSYRYKVDPATGTYGKDPIHDFASHGSDAFRGLACLVNQTEIATRKTGPEPGHVLGQPVRIPQGMPAPHDPLQSRVTLDGLFDDYDDQQFDTRDRI